MSGLHLARTERRIDEPAVITEAIPGISDGSLHRLLPSARGTSELALESSDETSSPSGEGRWVRYDVRQLEDGVYMAASVGSAGEPTKTYFTVEVGEVRRLIGNDRRQAERLLRRPR